MASYSIPMLLRRTVWINQLILDGARLNLVENEEGSWNVDALAVRSQDAEELPRPRQTVLPLKITRSKSESC
ncbi:MAG: hypothetical protein R2861_16245 [Desulfobacterales bacterium]